MRHFFSAIFTLTLLLTISTSVFAADPNPAPSSDELQKQQIDRASDRVAELQKARAAAAAVLTEMRQEVRNQTGLVEVTPDSIRQVIGKLQEQREQLELDGAGAAGRRKGIDEAVAELSAKIKNRSTADPVVDELLQVVDSRDKQLKRLQELNRQGVVSQESLDSAAASLATSKAELAAARQKSAMSPAVDVLDSWNRQRLELSINEEERQARLDFITKRLTAFSQALGGLDRLEEFRSRLEQADRAVAKAQDELELARRKTEMSALYDLIDGKAAKQPTK